MTIPVTNPPLKPHEGKTIFFTREELIRVDDALCFYLNNVEGETRGGIPLERQNIIEHIIDKINRHI